MLCLPCFRRTLRLALLLLLGLAFLAPEQAEARSKRSRKKAHRRTYAPLKFAPALPFSTVVIDAGHGGVDGGGNGRNILAEKNVALDVAQRLQQSLRRSGLRTVMTRSDDRFVTLDQRVAIANAQRDAIFMCIHFNSARRRGARGVETFYAAPSEAALAWRIQRNLAATTNGGNRGIKRASFRVLRNTRIRAVLAECGFLTNAEDAALASNPRYRETLAQQIAGALLEERNSLRGMQASVASGSIR